MKKIILPESVVNQPIPTLSDRQFVVTKSDLSDAEQKLQRELFWYREEFFKTIRGQWQEVCTLHPTRRNRIETEIFTDWGRTLWRIVSAVPTDDASHAGHAEARSFEA